MREDAHDDKLDNGPRHAMMQTYVDDNGPYGGYEAPSTCKVAEPLTMAVTGGVPHVV